VKARALYVLEVASLAMFMMAPFVVHPFWRGNPYPHILVGLSVFGWELRPPILLAYGIPLGLMAVFLIFPVARYLQRRRGRIDPPGFPVMPTQETK